MRQPGIWWYHYPELDDDWQWHHGPAWGPAPGVAAVPAAAHEVPQDLARHPGLVAVSEAAGNGDEANEADQDDERW